MSGFISFVLKSFVFFFSTFQWPLRIHENWSHWFFSFLCCMLILLYHSFTSPYSLSHPFLPYVLNCVLLVTKPMWSMLDCSPSKLVQEAVCYLVYGIFRGAWSSTQRGSGIEDQIVKAYKTMKERIIFNMWQQWHNF